MRTLRHHGRYGQSHSHLHKKRQDFQAKLPIAAEEPKPKYAGPYQPTPEELARLESRPPMSFAPDYGTGYIQMGSKRHEFHSASSATKPEQTIQMGNGPVQEFSASTWSQTAVGNGKTIVFNQVGSVSKPSQQAVDPKTGATLHDFKQPSTAPAAGTGYIKTSKGTYYFG